MKNEKLNFDFPNSGKGVLKTIHANAKEMEKEQEQMRGKFQGRVLMFEPSRESDSQFIPYAEFVRVFRRGQRTLFVAFEEYTKIEDKREFFIAQIMYIIRLYAKFGGCVVQYIPQWLKDEFNKDQELFYECFEEAKIMLIKELEKK